jgi:hypothetical protein
MDINLAGSDRVAGYRIDRSLPKPAADTCKEFRSLEGELPAKKRPKETPGRSGSFPESRVNRRDPSIAAIDRCTG